jgi:hypothetical protein
MAIYYLKHDITHLGPGEVDECTRRVKEWLEVFCIGEFNITVSRPTPPIITLVVKFHDEKDYMIASIKYIPSAFSQLKTKFQEKPI